MNPNTGQRDCRECCRLANRKARLKKREAA